MSKHFYCPICATIYTDVNNRCDYCGGEVSHRQSKHDAEYYEKRALRLYDNSRKWKDVLMDEEIKKSPMYDPLLDPNGISEEELDQKIDNWISDNVKMATEAKSGKKAPKCPTCGSFDVKPVSKMRRAAHMYAFGLFSTTARAQFECGSCGYKW